jgi:hypothetical protein
MGSLNILLVHSLIFDRCFNGSTNNGACLGTTMCDNIKKLEALLTQSLDESVLDIVSKNQVSEEHVSTLEEVSEQEFSSDSDMEERTQEPELIVFDPQIRNSTLEKAEKRAFLVNDS